jgi:hypothetical protein
MARSGMFKVHRTPPRDATGHSISVPPHTPLSSVTVALRLLSLINLTKTAIGRLLLMSFMPRCIIQRPSYLLFLAVPTHAPPTDL